MSHSRSLWSMYLRRHSKKAHRRSNLHRSRLTLEAFEPRIVLTATALDLNPTGDAFGSATTQTEFAPVGDRTFFVADNGQDGNELWVTDGTEAGTRQVLDINPGSASSNPGVFKEFKGELYFVANDGTNGEELWKSDGTASGTMMLRDIHPGSGYQYPYGNGPLQSFPRDLIEVNGLLLFSAEDSVNGAELWRTDGTAAGTMMVRDIFQGEFTDSYGTYPNSSNPTGLTLFNGEVYFAADDGTTGRELWKTDGTSEGTVLVSDLYTGDYDYIRDGQNFGTYPNSSSPTQFVESAGALFFIARDGLELGATAAQDISNYELWRTDGTDAGTAKVREIDATNVGGLTPSSELFDVGGLLVFAADDGISGEELWRSDGTEEGTLLYYEFEPGDGGTLSSVAYFTEHEGILYFTANEASTEFGFELWRTNGTFLGTEMVIDINAGDSSGFPVFMESVGDYLYFTANDGDTGFELWRSDGTAEGTFLLEDLIPGIDDAQPSSFGTAGDTLLFTATDDDNGRELWLREEDARDANAKLIVYVDGASVGIPANVGVSSNGDTTDIYTNALAELEFNTGNDSTLGDFFDTWRVDAGQVDNNPSAILTSSNLLGNVVDGDHGLQMFVNGDLVTEFDQYVVRPDDTIILVYGENPVISIQTNFGAIVVELFEEETPITVENFLTYVNDGDYVNSFFHRAAELADGTEFVIQGGGFRTTSQVLVTLDQLTAIPTDAPIQNEPGIPNVRGTISMAKLGGDPDSATSQFFVSLEDNRSILDGQNGGFTVFGQVLDMTAADSIAALPAVNIDGGVFGETPLTDDDTLVVVSDVVGNGGISGRHYADLNANNQYDVGEETVGVTVFADANDNGVFDTGETSSLTDSTGRYLLQVAPGMYSVQSLGATTTQPQSANVEIGRDVEDVDFNTTFNLVAPASIDLIDASDLGNSATDNLTSLNNSDGDNVLQFLVEGVISGAEVRVYSDSLLVGSGIASGTTATITTDGTTQIGNGAHAFTATVAAGSEESDPSPALSVEVSKVALGSITSAAPTMAQVGQTLTVDVQSDDEGSVSYSLVNAPAGMTIDTSTGVLSWTPTTDQAVPVTFDVVATDSAGNFTTQVVDLTVVGVIVASDDAYGVEEDVVLTVIASQGVLANDEDETATVTVQDSPSNGSLALNADGSFVYTPNQDFSGTDSFTYMATRNGNQSNVATATITVSPVNDAPVGSTDSFSTAEDVVLSVTAANGVLENDSDVDGDVLTASVVTEPTSGVLVLLSDGSVTYTPNAGFSGTDSFQYEVSDGTASTGPIDATIEVSAVDDAPVAVADAYTVAEDGSLTVAVADGVLDNDTDEEGDNLVATLVTQPQNGVVGLNSDGSFTYTPTADFNGTDTFGYRASDGTSDSMEVFVALTVTAVNDPPTANPDSFDASSDGGEQEFDVLANDSSEPDGAEALTITAVTQGSLGGTVTINSDGSAINYEPESNATGTETFTYTIEDTDGLTSMATVTVTLAAELGDSVISGFVYLDRNTDGVRDSDEMGVPGSLITLSGTENGGNIVNRTALTTDTGFYSFEALKTGTYVLTQTQPAATVDGRTTADMDDVTIIENEIANVVVTGDQTLIENNFGEETVRAEFMSIAWYFASAASSDSEAQTLRRVVAAAEERAGNVELATSIRDGSTEGPVNTAPVASTDSYTVIVNGTLDVSVDDGILDNDSDLNGDTLSATLDDTTDNGTLALDPDGSFTYTPDAGFTGVDSFTYFADDGTDQSNNALVTIIVDPEAPVETDDNEFSISESTPNGTRIGSVTPSAALGSERVYEIVNSNVAPELQLNPDDHFSGESDAQLVLIEYLSLQCPTCAQFHPLFENLKTEFADELLIVTRHLPLDPSPFPFAREAAQNAEAAGRQGMFDEMVDLLLTNQSEWSGAADPQPLFDGYAQSLGLDMTQFAADRIDPAIDAGITADDNDAAALGANGTPTIYLEGRRIDNGEAFSDFVGIIEDELDDYDAPFIVDRLTGDIIVSPAAFLNASSTPVRSFDVRITDASGVTTTESVTVNVTAAQAAQAPLSSASIVDAVFAELG